jgi:hypothetical protein
MRNLLSDKRKLFLWLLLLHLFYFVIALIYKKITNDDSPEYLWMASNIKNLGWFYSANPTLPIDPFFYSLRTPVYGFFILLVNFINPSVYAVLIAQNVVSIGVFMLLFYVLEEYKQNVIGWKIIVITLVLSPATLRLANSILSDSLFQAFIFLSFFWLLKYFRHYSLKYLVLYNVFLVIALFIKPAILYFWIPNMLFSIYLFYLNRKPVILLLSVLLPTMIFVWCYRNEKLTGYFHFSSITSQDIIECYSHNPLVAKYGMEYADSVRISIINQSKTIPDFKERSEFLHREGMHIIMENLPIYVYVHIRGMFSFMLDPGRPEIESFFPLKPQKKMGFFNEVDQRGWVRGVWYYLNHVPILLLGYLFIAFLWNVVLFISLLCFLFYKKNPVLLRLAVFIFVGYICSVSVISGFSRFRSGILPILIFTVPFFIHFLKDLYLRYRNKSKA